MATDQEIMELVHRVVGVEQSAKDIERLERAIADEAKFVRDLDAALKAGHVTQAEWDAGVKRAGAAILDYTDELQRAERALDAYQGGMKRAATGTQSIVAHAGAASGGVKNLTQSFLGLSRATQDYAQGGFGGILNNIEQLAMFAGPQIAAASTLIATAGYVAYRNWDSIRGLFEERWPTPEIDITPLAAVETKLEELKKKKEELGKKSTLNADEVGQLRALQAEEKQLQEEQKYQQRIKGLKDAHSRVQNDTAAAIDDALVQSGQARQLETIIDRLTKGAEANGSPAMKAAVAGLKERITKGDESAYRDLIDLSGAMAGKGLGKGSVLHKQLIENAPWKKREEEFLDEMAALLQSSADAAGGSVNAEKVNEIKTLLARGDKAQAKQAMSALADEIHGSDNAFSTALAEIDDGMLKRKPQMQKLMRSLADTLGGLNRNLRDVRQLNEQGMGGLAEAMEGLRKEAIEGLGGSLNKQLQESALKGGNVESLTARAVAEMKRLHLPIAQFPEQMAQVGRQLAVAAVEAADKALQDLMRSAQLTKAEAQRRMAADMEAATEKNQSGLVGDELAGMVQKQEQFASKFNPRMPRMTVEQRRAMAEQYRQYLEGLGIGGDRQVDIAKLFNSKQGTRAQDMFQALMGQGFDERTALEALPGIFKNKGNSRFNIDAEAQRAANREMGRQRDEANGQAAFNRTPDAQHASGLRSVGLVADNQAQQAGQVAELAGAVTEATNEAIRARQAIRAVEPILRTLNQRQRTAQLWGR